MLQITLNNLKEEGDINEKDFLDRVNILCSIGQTVMISNYQRYYKLLDYFGRFTKERIGIILGLTNLKEIFEAKFYRHLNGGILEGVGKMFNRDIKVYVYPYKPDQTSTLKTSKNINIQPRFSRARLTFRNHPFHNATNFSWEFQCLQHYLTYLNLFFVHLN